MTLQSHIYFQAARPNVVQEVLYLYIDHLYACNMCIQTIHSASKMLLNLITIVRLRRKKISLINTDHNHSRYHLQLVHIKTLLVILYELIQVLHDEINSSLVLRTRKFFLRTVDIQDIYYIFSYVPFQCSTETSENLQILW